MFSDTDLVRMMRNRVAEIAVEDFDYYRSQPRHLAWAMMHFELLDRIGKKYLDFPYDAADVVHGAGNKLPTPNDADLLCEAWGQSISGDDTFPDTNPQLSLEGKLDKTMDEWVSLYIDNRYSLHYFFPSEFAVKNLLLCTLGNGSDWNERGFIVPCGSYGIDTTIFAGYTRAEPEIPDEIKSKITRIRDHRLVRDFTSAYLSEAQEKAQQQIVACATLMDPKKRYTLLKKLGWDVVCKYSPLDEISNLVTMPLNAHRSYVDAGLQVAREIMENPAEPDRSKEYARSFLGKWGS